MKKPNPLGKLVDNVLAEAKENGHVIDAGEFCKERFTTVFRAECSVCKFPISVSLDSGFGLPNVMGISGNKCGTDYTNFQNSRYN